VATLIDCRPLYALSSSINTLPWCSGALAQRYSKQQMAHRALDAAVTSLRALKSWEHAGSRHGMQTLDWRPCRAVAKALGVKRNPLTVHVAGSKGKGTVCALVGAALERAGFRVGVITSPHAHHFGERLRIGRGRGLLPAGDELAPHLQRAVEVILDARRADTNAALASATQFDASVAASLRAAHNCDALVVEVGLGGARDSTNFLRAPVTALVSVELVRPRCRTFSLARRRRRAMRPRAGTHRGPGFVEAGHRGPEGRHLHRARRPRAGRPRVERA